MPGPSRCFLGDLRAAAEPVSQDGGARATTGPRATGRARRRPSRARNGRARSRSCRPGRSSPSPDVGADAGSIHQRAVGVESEDRVLVAVRLDKRLSPDLRRLPAGVDKQLGEGTRRAATRRRGIAGQEIRRIVAEDRGTAGFEADDRRTGLRCGSSRPGIAETRRWRPASWPVESRSGRSRPASWAHRPRPAASSTVTAARPISGAR